MVITLGEGGMTINLEYQGLRVSAIGRELGVSGMARQGGMDRKAVRDDAGKGPEPPGRRDSLSLRGFSAPAIGLRGRGWLAFLG